MYVNPLSGFAMWFDYYTFQNSWVISLKSMACYDPPAKQFPTEEFYLSAPFPHAASETPGSAPPGWTWGSWQNGQSYLAVDKQHVLTVTDQ